MKIILAITLAVTIGLMVSQQLSSKRGTVHTMGNPAMIVVTGGGGG